MLENKIIDRNILSAPDSLSAFASEIKTAVEHKDYQSTWNLIKSDPASAWFAIPPAETYQIFQLLQVNLPDESILQRASQLLLNYSASDQIDSELYLSWIDFEDPFQRLLLSYIRMVYFRTQGQQAEATEQSWELENSLDYFEANEKLHATIQIAVTALLSGDFLRALQHFTDAQSQAFTGRNSFLIRDAKAKSALIHAAFGETVTAEILLEELTELPRSSSWVEKHIDAHRDLAEIILLTHDEDVAFERLAELNLQDIGEMWPFYVLAFHRVLQSEHFDDEVEHRMEMFDNMSFAGLDSNGFSGSIIPLKRAILALRSGRISDAEQFLDRADPKFSYTKLVKAAGDIYAGRPQQALQKLERLRSETQGLRLLELRRIALEASAHYLNSNTEQCIASLESASSLPGGLRETDLKCFSPETHQVALKHIPQWPTGNQGSSLFMSKLPKPGLNITEREVEILGYLAQGVANAQLAEKLYISPNTLKSHLRSIYRKLNVNSADEAVLEAESRGII